MVNALIFVHYRCEACEKDCPDLSSMPRMSIKGKEMVKLMKAANLFGPKNGEMLRKFEYFCNFAIPADKKMLPKMVALLGEFYKSGTKMPNQWFYMMQESIKNHYRTQGSGFFFGDSEEILMGTKKFNVKEASEKIVNVKCTQIVSPFGVSYLY
jgi:hypothetical protein